MRSWRVSPVAEFFESWKAAFPSGKGLRPLRFLYPATEALLPVSEQPTRYSATIFAAHRTFFTPEFWAAVGQGVQHPAGKD
jgi:hypothetical protein